MSDQAKVTSLDALEDFRASSIVFLTKARQSVDQASDEVRRTRHWLQNEQRTHWEGVIRRCRRVLDQAQGELMSARMSEFIDSPSAQQLLVRKAKAELEFAEAKLLKVKQWNRSLDGYVDPMVKKLESLRHFLDEDMPKAVTYLVQIQRTLEDYAGTRNVEENQTSEPVETNVPS